MATSTQAIEAPTGWGDRTWVQLSCSQPLQGQPWQHWLALWWWTHLWCYPCYSFSILWRGEKFWTAQKTSPGMTTFWCDYDLNEWDYVLKQKLTLCGVLRKDIDRIERVQRHFTNRSGLKNGLSYSKKLKALDLPSLEYRGTRGDMIECYNITHEIYDPLTTFSCLSWTLTKLPDLIHSKS